MSALDAPALLRAPTLSSTRRPRRSGIVGPRGASMLGRWLIGGAVLLVVACRGSEAPSPSFEGAEYLELDCVSEGRAPDAEELRRLVEALAEAYGGAELWRELEYVLIADVYFLNSNDIMSNQGVREVYCRPDHCYRSIDSQRSGKAQRLLNAGKAWMSVIGYDLQETAGDNHVGIWWEWKTHRLPDVMARSGVELEGRAPEQLDGRVVVPVLVRDEQRPEMTVFIDPSGPVVRRVESLVPISSAAVRGGLIRSLSKEYSNFVRHDGVLVAERTNVYDGTERVLLVETRSFDRARQLADEMFSPEITPELPR